MCDSDWKQKYGDVVWAKAKSFSWWPCYIYDPLELPPLADKSVQKRAIDFTGNQYSIYYYGDGNFGFAKPSNIKPFNTENTAEYAKQTISKKYQHSFQLSIPLAHAELMLSKNERVSWLNVKGQKKNQKDKKYKKEKNLKFLPRHLLDDVLLFDLSDEDGQNDKSKNKTEIVVDNGDSSCVKKTKGVKRKSIAGSEMKLVVESESEEEQEQVNCLLNYIAVNSFL
jgi:hypothetical protein